MAGEELGRIPPGCLGLVIGNGKSAQIGGSKLAETQVDEADPKMLGHR